MNHAGIGLDAERAARRRVGARGCERRGNLRAQREDVLHDCEDASQDAPSACRPKCWPSGQSATAGSPGQPRHGCMARARRACARGSKPCPTGASIRSRPWDTAFTPAAQVDAHNKPRDEHDNVPGGAECRPRRLEGAGCGCSQDVDRAPADDAGGVRVAPWGDARTRPRTPTTRLRTHDPPFTRAPRTTRRSQPGWPHPCRCVGKGKGKGQGQEPGPTEPTPASLPFAIFPLAS